MRRDYCAWRSESGEASLANDAWGSRERGERARRKRRGVDGRKYWAHEKVSRCAAAAAPSPK